MATGSNPSSFTPLHYGGTLSPKGRLGTKPQQGAYFKKVRRLETIVRLENAAFPHVQMAAMLCISVQKLHRIMASAEYLNARIRITHGIIVDQQADMDLIKAQGKELLKTLLPPALQALANELQSQGTTIAERKHKVAIAQDLLDREGTFAKVSRTEVKPVDHFDFEGVDSESRSIIAAIRGVAAAPALHTAEAVAANKEFSNSHTLSAVDQQKALDALEQAARDGEISAAELERIQPDSEAVN